VVELTLGVIAHFKDEGVEPLPNPANGTMLLRQVRALVLIVRTQENLLRLLKPDASPRVLPQPLAFRSIKMKAHLSKYNCYTTIW
jgi:hypothetical protein